MMQHNFNILIYYAEDGAQSKSQEVVKCHNITHYENFTQRKRCVFFDGEDWAHATQTWIRSAYKQYPIPWEVLTGNS